MKISVDISPEYANPYAVIYTSQVTEEVQRMIDVFSASEAPITALRDENMVILQPSEIYMVRVEGGETIIYGEKQKYRSRKRLYEIAQQLGSKFMQISKTTLVNLSLAIFCIIGIAFDIRFDGNFSMENYQFTRMVVGCVIVGLGFGVPSIVYNNESLPMPIKVLIHMGIGCVVYTITAYNVGWIGNAESFLPMVVVVFLQLALAAVIWVFFMLFYRREAQKMNEKIQDIK